VPESLLSNRCLTDRSTFGLWTLAEGQA